jgi:hypothetical protein
MPQSPNCNRSGACLLAASLIFAPALFADLVGTSPDVPPANGVYSLTDTCITVVCLENITIGHFVTTSSTITGGNELTESNVILSANVFQNVLGMPGAFISPIQLTGSADITFFSKSALAETGAFNAQLTSLDLSGSFTGLGGFHTAEAMLNPAIPSSGNTTISVLTPIGSPTVKLFSINSFFDVFAELSIDGGPFVPGPERTGTLSSTPEPGYYAVVGGMLAMLFMGRIFRRKRPTVK